MTVYVVMGNDFPDAVFQRRAAAEAYCKKQRKLRVIGATPVYWRIYRFEVQ